MNIESLKFISSCQTLWTMGVCLYDHMPVFLKLFLSVLWTACIAMQLWNLQSNFIPEKRQHFNSTCNVFKWVWDKVAENKKRNFLSVSVLQGQRSAAHTSDAKRNQILSVGLALGLLYFELYQRPAHGNGCKRHQEKSVLNITQFLLLGT